MTAHISVQALGKNFLSLIIANLIEKFGKLKKINLSNLNKSEI